ncbi:MAG: FAD-dependent oxidoreductase, partial [Actinobacteria bacterium]|nr:FAD-dependent oxidoreductase [Actinomycetota bacterium]
LERSTFIGGRCSSTAGDGFVIDNFIHAFSMGSRGALGRVAGELGEDLRFVSRDPSATVIDGYRGRMKRFPQRLDMRPQWTRIRTALDIGVGIRGLAGGHRLFRDLMRADDPFIEERDRQALSEFLLEYSDDPQLLRWFGTICFLLLVLPPEEASAGEFIYCFREMFRCADFGYVRGSTGAIPGAYRRGLEKFGGTVRLGCPVEEILSDGGEVRGVLAGGEVRSADIVVSNAGIASTVRLVGERALGSDYAEWARSLTFSYGGAIVRYVLDEQVLDVPFVLYIADVQDQAKHEAFLKEGGLPEDVGIFMPVIDRCDPDLVPPGKQLLIAGTLAPASGGYAKTKELLDMVEVRLFSLFPGIERHVVRRMDVAPCEIGAASGNGERADIVGLAQSPGQVGADKPSPVMPVEGLYLVGTDAGARGVGTEQAAASAEVVARLVRQGYGAPGTIGRRPVQAWRDLL